MFKILILTDDLLSQIQNKYNALNAGNQAENKLALLAAACRQCDPQQFSNISFDELKLIDGAGKTVALEVPDKKEGLVSFLERGVMNAGLHKIKKFSEHAFRNADRARYAHNLNDTLM